MMKYLFIDSCCVFLTFPFVDENRQTMSVTRNDIILTTRSNIVHLCSQSPKIGAHGKLLSRMLDPLLRVTEGQNHFQNFITINSSVIIIIIRDAESLFFCGTLTPALTPALKKPGLQLRPKIRLRL